jgi:hypothetical protein
MGSLEDTIGEVEKDCQAARREGIIHHREAQYPMTGTPIEDGG